MYGGTGPGPLIGTSAANAAGEATAKSAAMPNAQTPLVALVCRTGGRSAECVSTDFIIQSSHTHNHRNATSQGPLYRNVSWLTVVSRQHPENCALPMGGEITLLTNRLK